MDGLLQDVLQTATEQLLQGTDGNNESRNQLVAPESNAREPKTEENDLNDALLEQVSLEFRLHVSKLRSGWIVLFRDDFDLVIHDQPYLFKMLLINASASLCPP